MTTREALRDAVGGSWLGLGAAGLGQVLLVLLASPAHGPLWGGS